MSQLLTYQPDGIKYVLSLPHVYIDFDDVAYAKLGQKLSAGIVLDVLFKSGKEQSFVMPQGFRLYHRELPQVSEPRVHSEPEQPTTSEEKPFNNMPNHYEAYGTGRLTPPTFDAEYRDYVLKCRAAAIQDMPYVQWLQAMVATLVERTKP